MSMHEAVVPMRQGGSRRSGRVLKRTALVLVALLGLIALLFGALLVHLLSLGWRSSWDQQERMEQLRSQAAALGQAQPASWSEAVADDSVGDELPYNELQVIGTHNSYLLWQSPIQALLIDLVEPGAAAGLEYEHQSLWDQLDSGIRSLELDLRWDGERFIVNHLPLVGNRTTAPDFALALEEIALWSSTHPGHLPISIMIELKDDYMFLDPGLERFTDEAYRQLDEAVRAGLGSILFTPDELRGDAASLRTAVRQNGWPSVGELRGKALLFLWDREDFREEYLAGAPMLEGRSLFTSSRTAGAEDAVFAVRDDPWDEAIAADLDAGIIVRTRADADVVTGDERRSRALGSGAQIVSTDYPLGWPQADSGYLVELPGGYLARQSPHWAEIEGISG